MSPGVYPPGELGTPKACTGELKRDYLHVERGTEETGFLTLVPRLGLTGAANPSHRSQAAIANVVGESGVGLAVFHLQRVVFHTEGFSVFHELLCFI